MTARKSAAKPKAKRATKRKPAPAVRMKSAEGIDIEHKTEGKLTPKQEAFCHAYVETSNASEALRRAYNCAAMKDETVWRNAHELLNHNSKVVTRIAELREALRKRHEYTVDDLVAELEEAREIAKKAEAAAPMVAATMGKGKLLGLVVEKNEHTGKDGAPLMQVDPSARELSRAVLDILREARLEGRPYDPTIDGEIAADFEPSPSDEPGSPHVAATVIRVFNPATGLLE